MKMQLVIFLVVGFFMAVMPLSALLPSKGEELLPIAAQEREKDEQTRRKDTQSADHVEETVFFIEDKDTGEILRVSATDFIIGAIAAEMPPTFHLEALKAQGLAAYTYALKCRLQNGGGSMEQADFTADPASFLGYVTKDRIREMYGDRFEEYYAKVQEAAQAVAGQVIVYNREPIVAAWHAISSGRTEDASNVWSGAADYLVPVDSSFDQLAPEYSTEVTFTPEEAAARIGRAYPEVTLPEEREEWFLILSRTDSGNVEEIRLGDSLYTGAQIRALFDLRSANFGVAYIDGAFSFDVAGYGHDVGLSQYGADYLARQGKSYGDIIRYYYTGVEIIDEQQLQDLGKEEAV